MRRFAPALLLLPALAACQPAAPKVDTAAAEQAIRAQIAAFNTAAAANDSAAIGAVYAQDAVLLPPNQERLEGTANIVGFFSGMKQLGATVQVTPTVIVVAASGDMAMEEGTWKSSIPTPDGSTFNDNGKYLVAWKKIDGTWLMERDIWNSDNAPPPSDAQ
jgi:uncharacterized protein (TIGR02246 family)